jgi:penicillin-binding protein 1A
MATRKGKRIEPRFADKPAGADRLARAPAAKAGKARPVQEKPDVKTPDRKTRRAPSAISGARTPTRRVPRHLIWSRLRRFAYWSLVAGVWTGIGLACIVGFYAAQLPQMSQWAVPDRPPNVRVVSAEGKLLANRGLTGGESLRLDEMSPWLPMAAIAIEDRRFNRHFGIDPMGFARAMFANAFSGRIAQGGSTLTQQLAKNLFLEPDRTIGRKVQEAVLALWLETQFSKDELLELYLNRVYFGSGAWGVDAAARRYFAKSARDLTLAEAAMIAGLVKAPSRLSPANDPKAARERASLVLAAMRREGFITAEDAEKALARTPAQARRYVGGAAQYVADMAMGELPALIGDVRADLIVETTILAGAQSAAEKALADALAGPGAKLGAGQGALAALKGDGAIVALVGGRDYAASQFNRAIDARRQPGSAFKPVVWLAALEAGMSPATLRRDAPVRIGNWTPENYDGKYRGPVTLADAMALSLNSIAAQLVAEIGPDAVAATAARLGIASPLQKNASIALGTSEVSLMEMTAGYAAFANGGARARPFLVRRVMTASGKVLYERKAAAAARAVGPREVAMMNDMLAGVLASGTGRRARLGARPAAGKTGTSQNSRDAWFVGYTAQLTAGVWLGNDDGAPMKDVTGGGLPAEIWAKFMTAALKDTPVAALPGAWQPLIAAKPAPRPDGREEAPAIAAALDDDHEGVIEGQPRQKRPRNLLEFLFGRKG